MTGRRPRSASTTTSSTDRCSGAARTSWRSSELTASSEQVRARILLVGDLVLDEPDPDALLAPSAPLLRSADAVVGHVEIPHTRRGRVATTDVPAHPGAPAHLGALARAGFTVATLAGNHAADAGPEGIEDTIATLHSFGIATAGTGATIAEARRPAVVEANGVSVGVLSYNCVGPRAGWARPSAPGCAYVNVLTHYELEHAEPGGEPAVYTFATPESLDALREDVAALRPDVDVVVVALHKGLVHVPATLAMYERPVAHAAIDAGADVVVGHHAHILKGVEIHRGKPIFHGLGNFATVTRALSPATAGTPEAAAWAHRRVELFGFEPDPAMPTYPFHPESRNTAIADVRVLADGSLSAGLVPCWIDEAARPAPLEPADGQEVAAYVESITRRAGLATELDWEGDVLVLREPAG